MSGQNTYTNTWMGLTYKEYYWSYAGDTGTIGPVVSDWMTQIWQRLCNGVSSTQYLESNGPFNGYTIEVWNSYLAQQTYDKIDGGIEHFGGLTYTNKLTRINSILGNAPTASHEFGHNYGFQSGIFNIGLGKVASDLTDAYRVLRSQDFTLRTNEAERWAEDFKFCFGANGVAGVRDMNDDANHPTDSKVGKQTRWADQVPGLSNFIQFSWPVFNWLKDKTYDSFNFFLDANGYFRWHRTTSFQNAQWECYFQGKFWKYDGYNWVYF